MSAPDPLALFQSALASPGTSPLDQAVVELEKAYPDQPVTLYANAELSRRRGDFAGALQNATAALPKIFRPEHVLENGRVSIPRLLHTCMSVAAPDLQQRLLYLLQYGELVEQTGGFSSYHDGLEALAAPWRDPVRRAKLGGVHLMAALGVLGFTERASPQWSDRVFEAVLLPWLLDSAAQGDFENALMAENFALAHYVKRAESQAWFKASTGRWIPQLAAAAREHAKRAGPRNAAWKREETRRVGLMVHNASVLAHVMVMIETLAAVRKAGARNYEFTVFVFGGRNAAMHEKLAACGAIVVYLDQGRPAAGLFERIVLLEQEVARRNMAMVMWVSHISMMAVAFPRRIAPLQAWWAMKYHACDVAEIDVHLAVENVVTRKSMEGVSWRTLGSASTQWLDPAKAKSAAGIRSRYPADALIAASIGREEKLDSPQFLEAVCELLRRHTKMVFLWTGRDARRSIQSRFETAGVADRTHFVGWVDTKAYAHAIDLFLDSFPFPCGFTLKEAMAAGKPVVMMRTPESLETGVPGAISPVLEGSGEVAPADRERLRRAFTATTDFDLYFCARDPAEYVRMASTLLESEALRTRAGEANREFIANFLSSPEDEARKFLDHLDELFETIPTVN